ncbi:MAG: sugar phosphate isomerase/epimerase [Candidatus Omnitrophota bacterium]|jgi:inosose dehydratase|nr:MAG: sugar phosphate isomerase/epimerase [Candidatus Omnitrophota bacterium]
MTTKTTDRRNFLKNTGIAAGACIVGFSKANASTNEKAQRLHLSTNQYSWTVFYRREDRDFSKSLDAGFADVAASGLNGFEASINSPQQIAAFAPLLHKHHLEMRSIYVNSTMHEKEEADKSIANILAVAEKTKSIGVKIIVTNPNPIRWGGAENKNDSQLKLQAASMNLLGEKLAEIGIQLAYHNHDIELREAAREFHHMMVGTNPDYVTLCLDAHWIYRGAGNSSVALFDILKLYGSRVSELHLRQSTDGVWAETFGDGDIDYPALAAHLLSIGVKPHLVLEIAVEKGTPKTLNPVEAHRRSNEYARQIFADFV